MARIEKTVFISYRRVDVYTALAVYENLKNQGYDVFFDYRSISSGDFEQIITSNIRARAHFILILTPTALDRCDEPGDWLRREVEIAIDEKRNIVPLFFRGFQFGVSSIREKLTGKLKNLSRYNGLNVHEDYFDEAMHRLRRQYLNIPLDTILHPVSTKVQKVVREQQVAADEALAHIEDAKELVKQDEEQPNQPTLTVSVHREVAKRSIPNFGFKFRLFGIVLIALIFSVLGGNYLIQNLSVSSIPTSTNRSPTNSPVPTLTSRQPTKIPTVTTTPKSPTATPTLGIGSAWTRSPDGMILMYVPAGEFTMGDDTSILAKPEHAVYLDAFWIDQTEVTNAMYDLCVQSGSCQPPRTTASRTRTSYYGNSQYNDYPVIYVDWDDADSYCEWAGARLPTEAEWEKAARGESSFRYPWGGDPPSSDWVNMDAVKDALEVGSYPGDTSPYGAVDMAGNVSEWVADWFSYYPSLPVSNPLGPELGNARVRRGGYWRSIPDSSERYQEHADVSWYYLGFRCAVSANP